MNSDQIDDLKQFLATKIDNSANETKKEIITTLRREIRAGLAGVADIFDKVVNPRLDDHEERMARLEDRVKL